MSHANYQKRFNTFVHHHGYALFIVGGVGVMGFGVSYYLSPLTLLKLNGIHLQYRAPRSTSQYLIGTHSESKSWAYRDGRLDTPLLNCVLDETGTVTVERDPVLRLNQTIHIRPLEWIKMAHDGEAVVNQAIPLNHLSLYPAAIVLDPQGGLVERQNTASRRLGQAVNFIYPTFPKGTQRPGSTWTEHLNWTDTIGEWKIGWEAELGWQLNDYEACYNSPCAKLLYQAEMRPLVVQAPAWAEKVTTGITFDGQGRGESLYNTREKLLISNTLNYSGRLSIQISSLENIPEEQRVGIPATAEPGTVVIEFTNKMDIRKPS